MSVERMAEEFVGLLDWSESTTKENWEDFLVDLGREVTQQMQTWSNECYNEPGTAAIDFIYMKNDLELIDLNVQAMEIGQSRSVYPASGQNTWMIIESLPIKIIGIQTIQATPAKIKNQKKVWKGVARNTKAKTEWKELAEEMILFYRCPFCQILLTRDLSRFTLPEDGLVGRKLANKITKTTLLKTSTQ
ncbi:Oidioi.mRNA.OKI2018_I69.YSR.g17056.t1.cds [Oikopleura dioica]|uniref:Oidioi.mRNA.OKI2018_I69.YSR.g17056.t1.cds n=1 Tax=Oikopleura dioica TaxID=34765 RepID=A0ABN7SM98_OIKDI|nr:Oidioi.mRNA.OKI2018_I69.YSR.g17056.t1.cds [Oikopleura dioica]